MEKGKKAPRPSPAKPGDHQAPSAKRFFEEEIPAALKAAEVACRTIGKTYQFVLNGPGGGSWVVDLATISCKPGRLEKPDLHLEMDSKDFTAMISGLLSGREAARTGRFQLRGNVELLTVLGRMLQPSQGPRL
ncbi:MAG: SCP2 sterol-binding domain-containing protein [Deltaproteobacteria bacterium]|nr:SCP2 sterol-binding domain-containing protein [Deltaproteobacteria bacterium]